MDRTLDFLEKKYGKKSKSTASYKSGSTDPARPSEKPKQLSQPEKMVIEPAPAPAPSSALLAPSPPSAPLAPSAPSSDFKESTVYQPLEISAGGFKTTVLLLL